jgi:hypothetical protein
MSTAGQDRLFIPLGAISFRWWQGGLKHFEIRRSDKRLTSAEANIAEHERQIYVTKTLLDEVRASLSNVIAVGGGVMHDVSVLQSRLDALESAANVKHGVGSQAKRARGKRS